MATFITARSVGQNININVQTSTGYWKYNHNGSDSSVFSNDWQSITVANANGEFTIIPCLSDGTVSGYISLLNLESNQLTSFDGTGLSSLTQLYLKNNQITSFDGTGLSSLTILNLMNNQLTSFDGTGLSSLTELRLNNNQLTSFDGTGLSSLTDLVLQNNQLTSFDGTDLSSLTGLYLGNNPLTSFIGGDMGLITELNFQSDWDITTLTSFDGSGLSSLTQLGLGNNPLTTFIGGDMGLITSLDFLNGWNITTLETFDGTGLSGLTYLDLTDNPLTTFIGGDMGLITELNFSSWNITTLTSFDGGNMSGLTTLYLQNNQITSFDGTGLSSLTYLLLSNNQLTSFDGTGLSSLTTLALDGNQLTTIDVSSLTSLTGLNLNNNQFTTIDVSSLTSLTYLNLESTQLTSLDITGLTSLNILYLTGSPITPSSNTQILNLLDQYGLSNGTFQTTGGRTSAGTADYDALVAKGWTLSGLDIPLPVTFITSRSVGQDIDIYVQTSTGYWKYNHDGSDSSVFSNGSQTITVANSNGEFTLIPCLSDGTVSGNITYLASASNQLTSFDGTGLTSLTYLNLNSNQLTSFDGTGLSSLTSLDLGGNQLTSFDGTGLSSLTTLVLNNNQLTSFDGTGLSSLVYLGLGHNQITSLDGFIFPTSLITLYLGNNQITSFDGTGLTSLVTLMLVSNLLTSLDVSTMTSLQYLYLGDPYGTGGNPMTPESNNSILSQLNTNGVSPGYFGSINGRTSAGTADYDALIAKGWNLIGLDLITPPPSGNGKLRIKGVNSGGGTTTTTTTEPVFYTYDFTSLTFAHVGFSNQFNKEGVTNWDGTYRIVATDLNIGTLVYYIGTDGDKHLFTFPDEVTDGTNYVSFNLSGILEKSGTVTFDSVTPFVVTTTTTTTEAPTTTTTTTTIPSLYWDSITLGSVDEEGNLLLNIDFTEYGFDDLSITPGHAASVRRTAMVIPVTGVNVPSNQKVEIGGVSHAIVPVYYFDNTNDDLEGTINVNAPSQDPTIGTINKSTLASYIEAGNVMTTDQVKLAVIQQSGGKKGSTNTYITDSLSSTIGTVQDILDIVPATTTTTTTAAPSYMFSIPNSADSFYKFNWSNITTTSGYWKFERTNDNGIYTSLVFGPQSIGVNGGIGYGDFTFISCDVNGNPSGTITQMILNGMSINSFNSSHPDLSGLTRLSIVTNSITSLDVSSLTNLDTLFITGPYGGDTVDSMTPQSNTDILLQLNANGLQDGTFTTNGGRVTSPASESAYLSLINKGWTLLGLTAV